MTGDAPNNDPRKNIDVPLQDVVLSNSWALQAILQYLEELNPGARDRIWQHYLVMKEAADQALNRPPGTFPEDAEYSDEEE